MCLRVTYFNDVARLKRRQIYNCHSGYYVCFCFEVLCYCFKGICGRKVPMGNLNGQLLALAFWNAFQLSTDQRSFAELPCCSNLRTHQMVDVVPQLVDGLRFLHILPTSSSHFPSPHLRNLQLVQSYLGRGYR